MTSLLVNPYFSVKRDMVSCMVPSRRFPWWDGNMYGTPIISFQEGWRKSSIQAGAIVTHLARIYPTAKAYNSYYAQGFLVKYDKMRIFVLEERETKSINLENDLTKCISIRQMDMVPDIEMSGKRSGFSKGTLKFMGWNLYLEMLKSELIIMINSRSLTV